MPSVFETFRLSPRAVSSLYFLYREKFQTMLDFKRLLFIILFIISDSSGIGSPEGF